jgi:hypothetical protein
MEVPMWLAIAGGILVGSVGLGALYDHVARRHGRNISFGRSPGNPSPTAQSEHNSFTI